MNALSLKINKREVWNSIILSSYLLLCIFSQMESLSRFGIFFLCAIWMVSVTPLLLGCKIPRIGIVLFVGVVSLSILRGYFYIPIFFLLTAPLLAKFVINSKFNMPILYITYSIILCIFIKACIEGVLNDFLKVSRNYVSAYMLFNSSLLALIVYRQKHRIMFIPFLLTFIVSLISIGRSGIVCSIILLLFVIMIKLNHVASKMYKIFIYVVVAIMFIATIPIIRDFFETSQYLERLRERGLVDDIRSDMRQEYLSNINFETFVAGADYTKMSAMKEFDGNSHNSYIRMHGQLGIFAIILWGLILYSLKCHVRWKEYIYVCIPLVLLLRAWTDEILLYYYDFLIWICIFHAFKEKRQFNMMI